MLPSTRMRMYNVPRHLDWIPTPAHAVPRAHDHQSCNYLQCPRIADTRWHLHVARSPGGPLPCRGVQHILVQWPEIYPREAPLIGRYMHGQTGAKACCCLLLAYHCYCHCVQSAPLVLHTYMPTTTYLHAYLRVFVTGNNASAPAGRQGTIAMSHTPNK